MEILPHGMGTEVQLKSELPGHHSMRDLNEDSNSCSWPLYHGDNSLSNGHFYNGFLSRTNTEMYPGYGKDIVNKTMLEHEAILVKKTMLEHEAIFRDQLGELHRLYKKQRDLMDEAKRKELHRSGISVETSLASSPLVSQITSEDVRKWHIPSLPVPNSGCAGPSTSGAEGVHSPVSSVKGNSKQAVPFPFHNNGSFRTSEMQESRPSKLRRKTFDLGLPAEEYIDTDELEQVKDEILPGMLFASQGCKSTTENGGDLFLGSSWKADIKGDAFRSIFPLNGRNITDLNQPIHLEDTNASSYVDLRGQSLPHGESLQDLSGKSKSLSVVLPQQKSQDSHHSYNNGALSTLHTGNDRNARGWLSHALESGDGKGRESISQGLQLDKKPPSLLPQALFGKIHENPRDRAVYDLDSSEGFKHPESVLASQPNQYQISSPEMAKSLSNSIPYWERSTNTLSQKSMSIQMHPRIDASSANSKGSQSAMPDHGIFGQRWHDKDVRPKPSFGNNSSSRNGFYPGFSSGSKELPSRFPLLGCEYHNSHSDGNSPPTDIANHASYPGSSYKNSARDLNLNAALQNGSCDELSLPQNVVIPDEGRRQDLSKIPPWLRAKSECLNEATVSSDLNSKECSLFQSSDCLITKDEAEKGLRNMSESVKAADEFPNNKKILGVPIFERPPVAKNESSSFDSDGFVEKGKLRTLDINLPCDQDSDIDKETSADLPDTQKGPDLQVASSRHQIDLNSCLNEDEISLMPSAPTTNKKLISEIDLEAPPAPDGEDEDGIFSGETLEDKSEASQQLAPQVIGSQPDDAVKSAAEAIVAISSAACCDCLDDNMDIPEASKDTLNWFADIAFYCGKNIDSRLEAVSKGKRGRHLDESTSEEVDYFESMTLKLKETKSEDYFPKPLIPEGLTIEESAATLTPSRPRRGQARRGRQRRDFQRDILPGLASLSRHEVTEDLQTFGGLMRATGHSWQSGLTRRNARNGCLRGRRRSTVSPSAAVTSSAACASLTQQLNNIEVGLEDRSLTGWGKTTRRPRRQRCPAGNLPSVPLT